MSSSPVEFWGKAHPPPQRNRGNIADLSSAEICTTNMGRNGGTDVLVEHDHGNKVGSVRTSWEAADGSLRVAGVITDPTAAQAVRSGKMRGLSLGTSVIQDLSGNALLRSQDEISICVEPRRAGCYIDRIDGKKVRTTAVFSASNNRKCRALFFFIKPAYPSSLTRNNTLTSDDDN